MSRSISSVQVIGKRVSGKAEQASEQPTATGPTGGLSNATDATNPNNQYRPSLGQIRAKKQRAPTSARPRRMRHLSRERGARRPRSRIEKEYAELGGH